MNKQINLQEAIQIAELLKNCNIVVNVDSERVAVTEQQVLDYAIELAVKNNTGLLEQVKNIEQNLYRTGLRIEIATRKMVMTDSQIYMELRVFADMLDSKSRYVKLDEIGLSDVLTNILTKAKYSMVYNLVQDKNGLTEAKLEKILSQYPEVAEDLKKEFISKMQALGFKWVETTVAGKTSKRLVYEHKNKVEVDVSKYMEKLQSEAKQQASTKIDERIVETLIEENTKEENKQENKEKTKNEEIGNLTEEENRNAEIGKLLETVKSKLKTNQPKVEEVNQSNIEEVRQDNQTNVENNAIAQSSNVETAVTTPSNTQQANSTNKKASVAKKHKSNTKKEVIQQQYELNLEEVFEQLHNEMETIYSLPIQFVIDYKDDLKNMVWKGIHNVDITTERKRELCKIMQYISDVCVKQYAK